VKFSSAVVSEMSSEEFVLYMGANIVVVSSSSSFKMHGITVHYI